MSKILVRTGAAKWAAAPPIPFEDEKHLQKLLYASPELIPLKDEAESAVFIREAGLPGSGHTDLLGVDSAGNILLIETKLAKNREIRREVIGQILEYAAYLWKMPYEEFDSLFFTRHNLHLAEMLRAKGAELEDDEFESTVKLNLQKGAFQLLIAVDSINAELEKIISYISSQEGGLRLEALALAMYKHEAIEILVPQRFGELEGGSRGSNADPGNITEEELLNSCPDAHCRTTLKTLIDGWQAEGFVVRPKTKGASFKVSIDGKRQPVFWAFRDSVQVLAGELEKRGAPKDAVTRYREMLTKNVRLDPTAVISKSRPMFDFDGMTQEQVREFLVASVMLARDWVHVSSKK